MSSGIYTYTPTAEDKHTHITHTHSTHTRARTEGDLVRKAKVSRSTPFHFQGRVIDIRLSRTHYTHVCKHTHTRARLQMHTCSDTLSNPKLTHPIQSKCGLVKPHTCDPKMRKTHHEKDAQQASRLLNTQQIVVEIYNVDTKMKNMVLNRERVCYHFMKINLIDKILKTALTMN